MEIEKNDQNQIVVEDQNQTSDGKIQAFNIN